MLFSVNCEWGEWFYSQCSTTCGPGLTTRSRSKIVTEQYGGTCSGNSTERVYCNAKWCPSKFFLQSLSVNEAVITCLSSVHCEWGDWNDFSKCSKSCGSGTQTRSRTKIVTEKHGGSCSGLSTEKRSCNTQNCPSKFPFLISTSFL